MLQFIGYVGCIVLWIFGTLRTILKKKPLFVLSLFGMHLAELIIVGLKTAKEYGEKLPTAIASCLCFGFTWWLPLKKQMEEETLTDKDFERTPNDLNE